MPENRVVAGEILSTLPTEISGIISGNGKVTSRMVDDFLTKYSLSQEQRDYIADQLFVRVIFDGNEKAIRRSIFRMRVKNGLTLNAIAVRSPFQLERLEDIESGNFQRLRVAECRFFSEVYGIVCLPELDPICSEPDDGGVLLTLKDILSFDGVADLEEFAESVCFQEFDSETLPGLSGVVILCNSCDAGFPGNGELLLQVSEFPLTDTETGVMVLCCLCDDKLRVAVQEENDVRLLNTDVLDNKQICWKLKIDKLICQRNSQISRER